MIKDYIVIALSNLRRRGLRSILTMLGVIIGIAAVVSLISLGQGLREAITGQFSNLGNDELLLQSASTGFGPPGSTAVRALTDKDLKIVKTLPGTLLAIPRIIRVVSVEKGDSRIFSTVASVPNGRDELMFVKEFIHVGAESGKFIENGNKGKVVLGNDFGKDVFDKPVRIGEHLVIQNKSFEVVGILEKSSSFFINRAILMPEDDLKEVLSIGDEIDLIVIKISDSNRAADFSNELARRLRNDRNLKAGEEDFSIQTPLQSISSVNTILSIINFIFIGIAVISLLVGGIGIANTMYTSVLERVKEIGVMKAFGAKNKDVLILFIFEAGFLGLIGGIIGSILGLLLAFGIANGAGAALGGIVLKVKFSYILPASASLFSFLIGTIAGILPAIRASKLKPVEALRS